MFNCDSKSPRQSLVFRDNSEFSGVVSGILSSWLIHPISICIVKIIRMKKRITIKQNNPEAMWQTAQPHIYSNKLTIYRKIHIKQSNHNQIPAPPLYLGRNSDLWVFREATKPSPGLNPEQKTSAGPKLWDLGVQRPRELSSLYGSNRWHQRGQDLRNRSWKLFKAWSRE